MRILKLIFAGLLLASTLCGTAPASAERRVALVIGNGAYQTDKLANPRNDALDMAAALGRLGFEVLQGLDLDKRSMERLIRQFETTLTGADIAFFYYAGHGMQVNGQNLLVPSDAQLSAEGDIDFESLPLTLVLRRMEREAKTSVLLLDACRNNTLARNLAQTMGTRGGLIGQGLSAVKAGVGTLIGFSTEPGNVALDGRGRNSPYTSALLQEIERPGRDLMSTLAVVRATVMRSTGGKQVPWEHTSLLGPVVLKPAPMATTAPAVPPPPSVASPAVNNAAPTPKQAPPLPDPPATPKASAAAPGGAPPSVIPPVTPMAPVGPMAPVAVEGCTDPALLAAVAETDTAKALTALREYLRNPASQCQGAGRSLLRDKQLWAEIEQASTVARSPAAPPSKAGKKGSATASSRQSPGTPEADDKLSGLIARYLDSTQNPSQRHAGEVRELKENVERSRLARRCEAYATEALKLNEARTKEACRIADGDGELWDAHAEIHQSVCFERGPEKAAELAGRRTAALDRCRRAKAEATAWDAVQKAGKNRSRKSSALREYLKAHGQDGPNRDDAQRQLAALDEAQIKDDCQTFAKQSVGLSQRNRDDPACAMPGERWSLDHDVHLNWCLKSPAPQRTSEAKLRSDLVDTCTAPARDDAAWKKAQANLTIESVNSYLGYWPGGRHADVARGHLQRLCGGRWPEAKKGTSWERMSEFVDGECQASTFRAEAEKLRAAYDAREWKRAKDGDTRAAYATYLERTGGSAGDDSKRTGAIWLGFMGSGGKNSEEATSEIADFDAWKEATATKTGGTCAAYAEYLQQRPEGRFKSDARSKIKALIASEKRKRRAPARDEDDENATRTSRSRSNILDALGFAEDSECEPYAYLIEDAR